MKIKINTDIGKFKKGVINVSDNKGIPTNRFWRDRLKDAQTDNCCEVVNEKKAKTRSKPDQENVDD